MDEIEEEKKKQHNAKQRAKRKKNRSTIQSVIKIKANSSFRTFYGDVYVDCLVIRMGMAKKERQIERGEKRSVEFVR